MASDRWYAHPNDLIGGWSVLTHDGPPSELNGSNGYEVGTFMKEEDAKEIAASHNINVLIEKTERECPLCDLTGGHHDDSRHRKNVPAEHLKEKGWYETDGKE